MKSFLKALVKMYAGAMSPFLPRNCRFHPTCSAYALQALEEHGALKGAVLAARRLLRCHPFSRGPMLDPVPKKDEKNACSRPRI